MNTSTHTASSARDAAPVLATERNAMRNFTPLPHDVCFEGVQCAKHDGVATITIDRASASNAYSTSMLRGRS